MAEIKTIDESVLENQYRYASVLGKGMYLGLLALLATFTIYTLGLLDSYIPFEKLSSCWNMPVSEYLHLNHVPQGWGWIKLVGYGDFLNFIGISILSGTTILCYISIIPGLLRSKDYLYTFIAIAEVLVLVIAASGFIAAGGH